MGCGTSSASAPGKYNDDPDMENDGARIRYNKKAGAGASCADGGKDDDGREDDFFEVEEATGEQFMAVRPWIGQIEEPDNHNPVNNEQPDQTYALEYVYGYRCADSKQNAYWNIQGDAVYMTAALGVILDINHNTQKFFGGGEVESTAKNVANDQNHHTDDIMCLRLNPARDTCVSGQVGSKPTIFTWDARTGEKKQRIKIAKGARGIKTVAINSQGWICAADLHNEHQVYCYDQSGNCVFKEKGDTNIIYDCAWHPNENRFATAGKKHLYFWDATKPGGEKKKGIFNGHDMCSFASVAWDESGVCWSGGSNGKIYCWDDNRTCKDSFQVSKGKEFICALQYINGKLWAGGKDGQVRCIDTTSKQVEKTIDFGYGNIIRAIDVDNNGNILVGQRDGTITCVDASGNKTNIMSSHSDGEVWGLAQMPDGSIVTSGDDNKVMMWDPVNRCHTKTCKVTDRSEKVRRGGASTLSNLPDSQCSRAVAINNDWLAVAGNDGKVSIRACSSPDSEVHLLKESKEWIEVMSFSPDNNWLAVGSHDDKIRIYSTSTWNLEGTMTAHKSYIMALDWCAQSHYIRSNCGAYELLFHTVPDCKQDPSGRSNTKGTQWASKTCKFQWETTGIYPSGTDGTHVNSVCGSADGQLLATGDDYGLVNLFRDPCIKGRPRCYRGHSEHVVRVMFANSDAYLYSIGGYDQTLMQWKRC